MITVKIIEPGAAANAVRRAQARHYAEFIKRRRGIMPKHGIMLKFVKPRLTRSSPSSQD
jgi:hypothetical protein